MERRLALRRVVAMASLVLLAAVVDPAGAAKQPYVDGDRLEFELPDLDGKLVSSSDPRFRDRVVLIDLWATHCPPCLSEIPTFVDLEERYAERGLVIVGIAVEAEEDSVARRSQLKTFVAERGINYLILDGGNWADLPEALPALHGLRGLPVEILVGRDGRVVFTRNGYGYKKKWARKLEETIVESLALPGGTE
jgi:thiol-disulfide isomerase/thioredoxin